MKRVFDRLGAEERGLLRERARPAWVEPMLATLVDEPFSDDGWIFERKLDGERCLVFRGPDGVRLLSRNRKSLDATYPELVRDLSRDPCRDFVADGEVVAFVDKKTSFARLQRRLGLHDAEEALAAGVPVFLYLFDLLHLEGHDTTRLPQRARKALLRRALAFGGRVRFSQHRNERGESYLREACRRGWEGLIAKDAGAPYEPGRSRRWLKLKCTRGQELVVAGFTEPRGSRVGLGALLVGYFEKGRLRYAGKVGTGFDEDQLVELRARLERLERASSPFADPVREAGAHFARPELVGEFAFTEWTRAGRLRHPRFLGLRHDKAAREVVRERGG